MSKKCYSIHGTQCHAGCSLNAGSGARAARGDTTCWVEGERGHWEDGEGRLHHLPQGGGPPQHDVRRAQGEGGASVEDASGKRWALLLWIILKYKFQRHWLDSGQSSLGSWSSSTSSGLASLSRGRQRGSTLRLAISPTWSSSSPRWGLTRPRRRWRRRGWR